MIGTQQWSAFAWSWRTMQISYVVLVYSAAVPFLLIAAVLGRKTRACIYLIYIIGWTAWFAIHCFAIHILESQLTGVWATLEPMHLFYYRDWLIPLNATYFFLVIRLITPGLHLFGPPNKIAAHSFE